MLEAPAPTPAAAAPVGHDQAQEQADPARQHDGLFMRAAPGIGFFYSSNKSFNASGDRRVFRGGTFSLQFAIGGTVGRHVAMGGSYFRDQVWGLSSEDGVVDGDEPNLDDVSMTLHSTA